MENNLLYQQTIESIDMHPNFAFVSQIASTNNNREKFQHATFTEEDYLDSDYEKYFTVLDLKEEVEEEMENELTDKTINTFYKHSRSQKHCFSEFFYEIRDFKHEALKNQILNDAFTIKSKNWFFEKLIFEDMKVFFENMPGNQPKLWPNKLDEFLHALFKIPVTGFFHQPFKLNSNFYIEFQKRMTTCLAPFAGKITKDSDLILLTKMLQTDIIVNFLRGSFYRLLLSFKRLQEIERMVSDSQSEHLALALSKTMNVLFKSLVLAIKKTTLDFKGYQNRCERSFVVPEFKLFDFLFTDGYSATTDGVYIYEISASISMMHLQKIGTGRNGTRAGIIYKHVLIPLATQKCISIVYLKDKLYLKYNSEQVGMVDVYAATTLEKETSIILNISDYMKNPHMAQYNRNFRLFTDGNYLFSLVINHKMIKVESPGKPKEASKTETMESTVLAKEAPEIQKDTTETIKKKEDRPRDTNLKPVPDKFVEQFKNCELENKPLINMAETSSEMIDQDQKTGPSPKILLPENFNFDLTKEALVLNSYLFQKDSLLRDPSLPLNISRQAFFLPSNPQTGTQSIPRSQYPAKLGEPNLQFSNLQKGFKNVGEKLEAFGEQKTRLFKFIDHKEYRDSYGTDFNNVLNDWNEPQKQETDNAPPVNDDTLANISFIPRANFYEGTGNDRLRQRQPINSYDLGPEYDERFDPVKPEYKRRLLTTDKTTDINSKISQIIESEREFMQQKVYHRGDNPLKDEEKPNLFQKRGDALGWAQYTAIRSPVFVKRTINNSKFDYNDFNFGRNSLEQESDMEYDDQFREMIFNPTETDATKEEMAHFEMMQRSQNLYRTKTRKINNEKAVPKPVPVAQPIEGEKNLIEFFVIQFDMDKYEEQKPTEVKNQESNEVKNLKQTETRKTEDNPGDIPEEQPAKKSADESKDETQEPTKTSQRETVKKKPLRMHKPSINVLIYQTECQGYDFKQVKLVKNFTVLSKSLLHPIDVMTGGFYINQNLLLKNSGHLFSLSQQDEISVDPMEIENQEIFNVANRFFKYEDCNQFTPNSEDIDVLPKPLSRNTSQGSAPAKDEAKKGETLFKIRTTYIASHASLSLFSDQSNNTILYYDNYNSLFFTVTFEYLNNAHYNFIRQKFSYYCDNKYEKVKLNNVCGCQESFKTNAMSVMHNFARAKNLSQFNKSFLKTLLVINKNRSEMPKRLNDWVYLLSTEQKLSAQEKGKKSKANVNAKIKKLMDLDSKKSFENNVLYKTLSKKLNCQAFRELFYVYFLCEKGNFKTTRLLFEIWLENANDQTLRGFIVSFLKIGAMYFQNSFSVEELKDFFGFLMHCLRNKRVDDPETLSLISKYIFVLSQDKAVFTEFMTYVVSENKALLFMILKELFETNMLIKNKFVNKASVILTCNRNFEVDDKQDQNIEFTVTTGLKKRIAVLFHDGVNPTKLFSDIISYLFLFDEASDIIILNTVCTICYVCYGYWALKSEKIKETKKPTPDWTFDRFKQSMLSLLIDFRTKVAFQCTGNKVPSQEFKRVLTNIESFLVFLISSTKTRDINFSEFMLENLVRIVKHKLRECEGEFVLKQRSFADLRTCMPNEGMSLSDVHILETSHPVERGKSIIFKRIHHQKAIGFIIEFDKKCQNDEATDSLTFTSWFDPEKKGNNSNGYPGVGFVNKHLNISGRRSFKRNVTLIGNSLDIQFISSNVAKHNIKSLNQWGYKLYVRPIIGVMPHVIEDRDPNQIMLNVFIIRSLLFSLRSLIESMIKGTTISKAERSYFQYLNWSILQKGLSSLDCKNFIVMNSEKQYILNQALTNKQKPLLLSSVDSERMSITSKTHNDRQSFINEDFDLQELLRSSRDKSSLISTIVEYVRCLSQAPFVYLAEKKRASFDRSIQSTWEELEVMIILCYLHHANIIDLLKSGKNLDLQMIINQPNIHNELNLISKKRYEIITFLLAEAKIEEEFQSMVCEIFDLIKEDYIQKYIKTKIKKETKIEKLEEKTKLEKTDKKEFIRQKIIDQLKKKSSKNKPLKKQATIAQPKPIKGGLETLIPLSDVPIIEDLNFFIVSELKEMVKSDCFIDKANAFVWENFARKSEEIKKIFRKKEIEFTKEPKENIKILVNYILLLIKSELLNNAKTDRVQMSLKLENPYYMVGEKMKERLMFLLRINSQIYATSPKLESNVPLALAKQNSRQHPSGRDIPLDEEADLKPLGSHRAMTSEGRKLRSKIESSESEINAIRDWVEYYKNWKNQISHKEEDLSSIVCSPIYAVTKFLTILQPIKIEVFQSVIFNASKRISLRIVSFQHYMRFLEIINGTIFENFGNQFLSGVFSNLSIFENVQTTSRIFKNILSELAFNSARPLVDNFLSFLALIKSVQIEDIHKFKKQVEEYGPPEVFDPFQEIQNHLNTISSIQTEIYILINNSSFSHYISSCVQSENLSNKDKRYKLWLKFGAGVLEFMIFCTSLGCLSYDFRQISVAVRKNIRIGTLIMSFLLNSFSQSFLMPKLIGGLLRIELGETTIQNQINVNLLQRISDAVGENRLMFLLRNLQKALLKFRNAEKKIASDTDSEVTKIVNSLLLIVLHSNHSRIVKLSLCCLEVLEADFSVFKRLAKENIYKQLTFTETVFELIPRKTSKSNIESVPINENALFRNVEEKVMTGRLGINSPFANNVHNLLYKLGDIPFGASDFNIRPSKASEYYDIYLHMINEEDLCPLVRVFYNWEILYPTFTKRLPKNFEECLELTRKQVSKQEVPDQPPKKEVKTKDLNLQFYQQMTQKMRLFENVVQFIPDFNCLKGELPFGWYFNTTNIFSDMKFHKAGRKTLFHKTNRKLWENKNLNKLIFTLGECLKLLKPPVFITVDKEDEQQNELEGKLSKEFSMCSTDLNVLFDPQEAKEPKFQKMSSKKAPVTANDSAKLLNETQTLQTGDQTPATGESIGLLTQEKNLKIENADGSNLPKDQKTDEKNNINTESQKLIEDLESNFKSSVVSSEVQMFGFKFKKEELNSQQLKPENIEKNKKEIEFVFSEALKKNPPEQKIDLTEEQLIQKIVAAQLLLEKIQTFEKLEKKNREKISEKIAKMDKSGQAPPNKIPDTFEDRPYEESKNSADENTSKEEATPDSENQKKPDQYNVGDDSKHEIDFPTQLEPPTEKEPKEVMKSKESEINDQVQTPRLENESETNTKASQILSNFKGQMSIAESAKIMEMLGTSKFFSNKGVELEEMIHKFMAKLDSLLTFKGVKPDSKDERSDYINAKLKAARVSYSVNDQTGKVESKSQAKVYKNVSPEEQAKIQDEYVKSYCLLFTLIEVCKSIQTMSTYLNYTGYTNVFLQNLVYEDRLDRVQELAYLIDLLLQRKMKEISFKCVFDDIIYKKLIPVMKTVNDNNFTLDVSVSIVRSSSIPNINRFVKYSSKLKIPFEDFAKYANKFLVVSENSSVSNSKTLILNMIAEFINKVCAKDKKTKECITGLMQRFFEKEELVKNPQQDIKLKVGLMMLTTEWNSGLVSSQDVTSIIEGQQFKILGPPSITGKKHIIAINQTEPRGIVKLESEKNIIPLKNCFDLAILEFDHALVAQRLEAFLRTYNDRANGTILETRLPDIMLGEQILFICTFKLFLKLIETDKRLSTNELRELLKIETHGSIGKTTQLNKEYLISIERIADNNTSFPIFVFENYKSKEEGYSFEVERRKLSANMEKMITTRINEVNDQNYNLAKSSLLSGIEIRNEKVSEFKMLKYWEKNIIPKILSFVKGSLSQFEIDDFFEQMRIELRKENNAGASHIAYVLCDQKLPNDCVLPQLNYDWNCLDLDAIKIGQYVSFKIKDDRSLYCRVFEKFNNVGITFLVGIVVFKDPINNCVNLLVLNFYQTNLYSVWIPQQAIRRIEYPLPAPAKFCQSEDLRQVADTKFNELIKSMKSEYFFNELITDDYKLSWPSDVMMTSLMIKRELRGNCLSNWLNICENSVTTAIKNPTLNILISKIISQNLVEPILDGIETEIDSMVAFSCKNNYSFNMTTKVETDYNGKERAGLNSNKYQNLNIFEKTDEIDGIIVEFKSNSNLYRCSGLKFFDDSDGINLIEHIHSTQNADCKTLYPLVFNKPDVYYQFYHNSDALPAYMKSQITTKLECTVFAVSASINYILFMTDILSSHAILDKNVNLLCRVLMLAISLFKKFRGSNIVKQYIFKMMTRLLIKTRAVLKNPGILANLKTKIIETFIQNSLDINALVKHFEFYTLQSSKELYSSYVQDLTEFLAVYSSLDTFFESFKGQIGTRMPSVVVRNKKLEDIKQLFSIADFLANSSANVADDKNMQCLWDIFKNRLTAISYFDNLILISNIPALHFQTLKRIIDEVILKEGMKILVPVLDIYIPSNSEDNSVGYAIILYDGWEFKDQDKVEPTIEEKKPEEEIVNVVRFWSCEVCTLLNEDSAVNCSVCEAPKPEDPVYPDEVKPKDEQPPKRPDENQDENLWSNKVRMEKFKDELLAAFERATPDKRVTVKRFEINNWADIESSNEILEFLLNRMTSELFQSKLIEICNEIHAKFESIVKSKYELNSGEEVMSHLLEMDPFGFFKELSNFGYDLWLEKSCLDEYYSEPLNLVSPKDIEKVIELVIEDVCDEADYGLHFSGTDFRLEFKNPLKSIDIHGNEALANLKYKESKFFFFKHMKMNSYSNFTFRLTITAVQLFNSLLKRSYKLLDLNSLKPVTTAQNSDYLSLGVLISNIRNFWFNPVKHFISEEIMNLTTNVRDHTPKIYIERLTKEKEIITEKKNEFAKTIKKEHDDKNFILIQSFKQMIEISPSLLRPPKPKGTEPFICFEIVFKGEHVMGEGGPYRQFFSDISAELQPVFLTSLEQAENKRLNLFIPSPNRSNDIGDYKDKFVINPSKKASYYLQLYEYVGILMGCAFRTNVFLSLNLPTMFWKKMVGQPTTEEDLEEIDKGIFELIKYFRNCSEEDLEDNIFQNFTVLLSDVTEIELVPDGRNIRVTHENKDLFIRKVLEARIGEADVQIGAIRSGFTKIVPEVLLNCLNARDLEKKVCGKNVIDFNLLKKYTRYSGKLTEDSPLIKNFWESLYSFTNADKQRFIKFCWGQERLPSTCQEFENAHIRFMIKPSLYDGPQDGLLPRADTCFFNFELPNYSTLDIMKEKILLAIHTDCDSMNAEENRSENQNNEENSWVTDLQKSEDYNYDDE